MTPSRPALLAEWLQQHPITRDSRICVIQWRGKDAATFLQAQCMNDVQALNNQPWQWNGWLSPQGKLQGLFVLCPADDGFDMLLLDVPAETFINALMRFKFRAKVTAEVLPAHVYWSAEALDDCMHALAITDDVSLCVMGEDQAIADVAADGSDKGITTAMLLGLPRGDAESLGRYTPQMLGLSSWQAFSTSKGCYPGQEIVARTHFLGKNKRSLQLFMANGDHMLADNTAVVLNAQTIGTVLSHQTHADQTLVQAIVNREGLDGDAAVYPAQLEDGQLVVMM